MPLSKPLSDFKQDLKILLLDDLAGALKLLQENLPDGTAYYNTVIGLLARLNDANKSRLRGAVSNEELQRLYNGIRSDFMLMIDLLVEADFDQATKVPADAEHPAPRQGSVLYRIPHQMPVQKETKCVVRIAVDEDAIVENITIDQHVELKALKRVSDLMMVELTDPSADAHFQIRTTSVAEQIITLEGYSEWFFYVKPLQEGAFPLEIKVSVIELVLGREAKKEYVLSETIQIIADLPVNTAESEAFKPAGVSVSFVNSPGEKSEKRFPPAPEQVFQNKSERDNFGIPEITIVPPPAPPSLEIPPPSYVVTEPLPQQTPPRTGRPMRAAALFLAFLVLGSATTWAVTPAATFDYWLARIENTESAYTAYLEKYPAAERTEEVMYRRAILADRTQFYRQYLSEYSIRGKYKERISKRMDELETERYIAASRNLSAANIRQFVADFPATRRVYELKKAYDALPGADPEVSDILENTALESIRLDPTEAKIRLFIQDFPGSNRLQEINDAINNTPALYQQLQPELEEAFIKKIENAPSKEQIKAYLQEFSEPVKIEKLKKIIEDRPALKKEMQLEIKAIEQRKARREQ